MTPESKRFVPSSHTSNDTDPRPVRLPSSMPIIDTNRFAFPARSTQSSPCDVVPRPCWYTVPSRVICGGGVAGVPGRCLTKITLDGSEYQHGLGDRESTRLNCSHVESSYAVLCL